MPTNPSAELRTHSRRDLMNKLDKHFEGTLPSQTLAMFIDFMDAHTAAQVAAAEVRGQESAVSAVYGIANDLANKDPKALGAVSLAPYFSNAVTIYQEYLKGDNYERIDWKSLELPTLVDLTTGQKEKTE